MSFDSSIEFSLNEVTAKVYEILAEDRDTMWDASADADLMIEVQNRCKLSFTAKQQTQAVELVKLLLRENKIGGTWPTVWADPAQEYEIDKLRARVGNLLGEVENLRKHGASEVKETIVEKVVEKFVGVQLLRGKKIVKKTTGVFHSEFQTILDLADMRMNIFLFGPTGCGKSHVCEQLAEALGLPYRFVSCTSGMSEGIIGGKLLPVGKSGTFEYVISEFVKSYEDGGVFLLDEIDAADPNVLLFINAALASAACPVSNRVASPYAKRHPDFICIAAANTAGTNADRMYSGRNKLDAATLDRFQVGKVMLSYDENIEKMLCPDEDLLAKCHQIRKSIEDHRLERAMSTRFIRDAYVMTNEKKWTWDKVLKAYFAGWRDDEITKVKKDLQRLENLAKSKESSVEDVGVTAKSIFKKMSI